jgi:hypothetical protein
MRFARVAPALLGALAFALPVSTAHAAEGEYVAMGDSYSSGTGAGSYSDLLCTRSRNAYPAKWADANSPGQFSFVACGGATIPDVESSQLQALDSGTSLVSISIGGNDSGFASTMLSCRYSTDSACRSALDRAGTFVRGQLPGQLDRLYGSIKSRAPQAKVGGLCVGGLSATKRAMINDGSDLLNGVISDRAQAAGFAFADGRPAFAGHEICTSAPWISSSNVHPTAEGHANAYLPAFTAAAQS